MTAVVSGKGGSQNKLWPARRPYLLMKRRQLCPPSILLLFFCSWDISDTFVIQIIFLMLSFIFAYLHSETLIQSKITVWFIFAVFLWSSHLERIVWLDSNAVVSGTKAINWRHLNAFIAHKMYRCHHLPSQRVICILRVGAFRRGRRRNCRADTSSVRSLFMRRESADT